MKTDLFRFRLDPEPKRFSSHSLNLKRTRSKIYKNYLMAQSTPVWPILHWQVGKNTFQNKKTWKIRVVLISGLKWHLSGIACFSKYPTHLALFCKIEKSSTMHSESKLNRKRNFRFVRFLSQFPSSLYFLNLVYF